MRWFRVNTAIALNTFREAVRNKIFGSLIFFAVLLIIMSIAFGELSLHNEVRVARDLTFFTTSIFAMIITVYSSVTLLHTEIEKQTIYTILSKPIRRWEFLVGKFTGIQLLLSAILLALFAISSAVILLQGGEISAALAWGHVTLLLQMSILTAVAMLMASFSSSLLSGLVSVAIFVAGNLMTQLAQVEELLRAQHNPVWRVIAVVQYLLPNLESLNLAEVITYSIPLSAAYLGAAFWYAAAYTAIVMLLAMIIFSRRDFV